MIYHLGQAWSKLKAQNCPKDKTILCTAVEKIEANVNDRHLANQTTQQQRRLNETVNIQWSAHVLGE